MLLHYSLKPRSKTKQRVMTIKYLNQPNQKVTLQIVWIILGNYLNILAVNLQPLACQSYQRYVSCINRSSFLRWAKRCKEAVTTEMFYNVLSAGEESIVPGILREKKRERKDSLFRNGLSFITSKYFSCYQPVKASSYCVLWVSVPDCELNSHWGLQRETQCFIL